MNKQELKFEKMWEVFGLTVFDADADCIEPIAQLKNIVSFSDDHCLFYSKNGRGEFYYEKNEMEKAAITGAKDFMSKDHQKKYFDGVSESINKIGQFILERKERDLCKISDKLLYDELEIQLKQVIDIYTYYAACQPQVFAHIEEDAKLRISTLVSADDANEVYSLLCTPDMLSSLQKEELAWLRLVIEHSSSKPNEQSLKNAIEKHADTYGIIFRSDASKDWTSDDFMSKFKMQNKESLELMTARLEELLGYENNIATQKLLAVKKHQLPKEVVEQCNMLAKIAHERLEMRVRGWNPATKFMGKYFGALEERLGYSFRSLENLSVDEVYKFIRGWRPEQEDLDLRRDEYLIARINRKKVFYYGDAAGKKLRDLTASNQSKSNRSEFTGSVAMKGRVTGRVVVFRWGDDVGKKLAFMGDCSVLVAGQTRPQLMPLIHKSIAIVTDEGGIISHAAIVARELKKPCIIGTKIATQVLKDGDLVEVDADNGVVRILEKAK